MSNSNFTFPVNSTSPSAFTRSEALITPTQLKERYLFGVNLTDDKGNELPEAVFQHAINTAVSFLEHSLDIVIFPQTFVERYDYRQVDYMEFNFLQLKKRPASEVTSMKAKFPANQELVDYPKEWFVLEKEASQLQLSPVEGTFSGLVVTQGGSYVPLIYGARSSWPHLFEVTYVAGFKNDQIPVIINEMIGLQAAIRIFDILGDMILGAGISNQGVGLDGANVSTATPLSAMYSGYSARIESYRKSLQQYTDAVRKYYSGIPSIVG